MTSDFSRMFGDSRTEHQVSSHKGFRPTAIYPRANPGMGTDAPATMLLATPPGWMQRDDLPCIGRWDDYDMDGTGRTLKAEAAAKLCEGCPVIAECLADALAKETDCRPGMGGRPLGEQHRYGIRGGLIPKDRAALAGGMTEEKRKERDRSWHKQARDQITTCANGHEWKDETTYVAKRSDGKDMRMCMVCRPGLRARMNEESAA